MLTIAFLICAVAFVAMTLALRAHLPAQGVLGLYDYQRPRFVLDLMWVVHVIDIDISHCQLPWLESPELVPVTNCR